MKPNPREKILFLESVRGLAACTVLVAHLLSGLFPAAAVTTALAPSHSHVVEKLLFGMPFGFLLGGHFAVMTFFVLSGFVLSIGYFQSRQPGAVINQALKRYIRLGVPIFLAVIVGYLLLHFHLTFDQAASQKSGFPVAGNAWSTAPHIASAIQQGLFGAILKGDVSYDPVLWTMHYELLGSFIVFSLLLLVGNLRKRWLVYPLLALLFWNSYFLTFVAGTVLADIFTNQRTHFRRGITFRITGLAVVAIIASIPTAFLGKLPTILTSMTPPGISLVDSMMLWQSLGAILLLYIVLSWPRLQAVLEHRTLSWLGKVSFGLYLTHYLILASFSSWFFSVVNTADYRLDAAIVVVVTIPVCLLAAAIWTKYIDGFAITASRNFAAAMMTDSAVTFPSYLKKAYSIIRSPLKDYGFSRRQLVEVVIRGFKY